MNMNNLTAFGELLNQHIQRVRRAGTEWTLELGTIGGDLSLTVDGLKDVIPKGDYLLALRLTALTGDDLISHPITHVHEGGGHSQYTGSGHHTHTDGKHSHVLPEPLRGIRPGDRVIVSWVGGQPIVMDIVTGSKELTLDGR